MFNIRAPRIWGVVYSEGGFNECVGDTYVLSLAGNVAGNGIRTAYVSQIPVHWPNAA